MYKKFKKIITFLIIVLLVLLTFSIWYKNTYSMEEVKSYTINETKAPYKVAIATQGSDFKNAITTNIINHYKLDSVYLNVFDVSKLPELKVMDYNAIVILHTWEYGKAPIVVSKFVETNISEKNKIIVLTTSGKGSNRLSDVDALAGASIIIDAGNYSDDIIMDIESLLSRN